jgi:hypothetical protein
MQIQTLEQLRQELPFHLQEELKFLDELIPIVEAIVKAKMTEMTQNVFYDELMV